MDKQKPAQQNNVPRIPIVCVMGHVDHGKSTLLDFIRKTNIVDKEVGGITQKIGAYKFLHEKANGEKKFITFLDTPGHEAFGAIRKRGANVADIAILVVSAEDGVKPQTLDAYSCIQNSKLPFIVAITKIDKSGADVERTKQSLAENAIYLEGYGGDVPWAPISSKTGEGVPELLDLVDLLAEMNELSGDPKKEASGFIVESNHDNRRGSSATVIIRDGSLKTGDSIVAGSTFSHVKIMEDDHGKSIKEANMSSPIKIVGWNKMPEAGLPFKTLKSKKDAEEEADKNLTLEKIKKIVPPKIKKLNELGEEIIEEKPLNLPIIIKADAAGTIDAIMHELKKIETEKVKIQVISKDVGDISEGDAKVAESVKNTIIIGFNVKTDSRAKTIAERSAIEIKHFDIIYKLSEWLGELIKNSTPKVKVEEKSGIFRVLKTFSKEKDKQIIGGKVLEGEIKVGDEVKISRNDTEIGRGKIRELQKQKNRVEEISAGFEFGTMIESKITIVPKDAIEAFKIVEK